MKLYNEWSNLKVLEDSQNPFSTLYAYDDGSMFYIEPIFYTMLKGFEEQRPGCVALILKEMEAIVKKNGNLEYFNSNKIKDAIVLEIFDVTDKLQIYVEDKSRGSDYGD